MLSSLIARNQLKAISSPVGIIAKKILNILTSMITKKVTFQIIVFNTQLI